MRKFIYTILLAAAAASCSKNDVVESVVGDAISFGDVFVGNSTKADPSHTTDNLEKFFVYGNVELNNNTDTDGYADNVMLYDGAPVTKDATVWNCEVTQYWLPGCTYNFAAVTDVGVKLNNETLISVTESNNGMPTAIKYDVRAQKDLLYAEIKGAATDNMGVPDDKIQSNTIGESTTHSVAFSFNHLLSKVQFEFTNNFAEGTGVELTVTGITIKGAAMESTYSVSEEKWRPTSYTANIDFGSTPAIQPGGKKGTSSNVCFLIATEQSFEIHFTVTHNKGGKPTKKTITMTDVALLPGYSYNFTAELNSNNVNGVVPIKFKINRGDWSEDNNVSVGPDVNEGDVNEGDVNEGDVNEGDVTQQ